MKISVIDKVKQKQSSCPYIILMRHSHSFRWIVANNSQPLVSAESSDGLLDRNELQAC